MSLTSWVLLVTCHRCLRKIYVYSPNSSNYGKGRVPRVLQVKGNCSLVESTISSNHKRSCRKNGPDLKKAIRKSSNPPLTAEFLMQYRRTPNSSAYSPSELLNGRQIRTKLDTLMLPPAHDAQKKQAKELKTGSSLSRITHMYKVGDPCYALYFGPRRDRVPRWAPALVSKRCRNRSVWVRVIPRGPTWRRHNNTNNVDARDHVAPPILSTNIKRSPVSDKSRHYSASPLQAMY